MLWPCNLACGWGESSGVAWARGGRLNGGGGISDAMGRTLESVWVPGQQARVVVALRGLLGVLVDYLCRHTLKRTRSGLGRRVSAFDAWLGLSVDEGGDWGQFRVVGVVDGFDPMLLSQLICRQRRASDRRDPDAFRTGWLGRIHERNVDEKEKTRHRPCLESPKPTVTESFQPWRGREKQSCFN